MTNSEYEKASVQAAESTAKFEGEHKLKELDGIINNIEKALSNLHAERRELVNRYDLNKDCTHFAPIDTNGIAKCIICKQVINDGTRN